MTDDLVKRLRCIADYDASSELHSVTLHASADRIEEMEEALLFIWKSKTLFDSQIKARTVLKREQK